MDNGIILKKKKNELKLPWYVEVDDYLNEKTEICYWRKCWGIRGEILNLLHVEDEDYPGSYSVEFDDIPAIIKVLERYLDREYWDKNASSIWEYEEHLPHNIQNIKNLLWLKEYLEENPDAECYFYDSY